MFKFIARHSLPPNFSGSLCDVGCATGEFLYYLRDLYPLAQLNGVDIMDLLIKEGRKHVPTANFYRASVLSDQDFKFDKVFMSGILAFLPEFIPAFQNLISWTNEGGQLYITEMFNPYPVDVQMKHRVHDGEYQDGWNIYSQEWVSLYLDWHPRVKSYEFIEFNIPIDLAKPIDPMRSWTIRLGSGERIITNGLSIIEPFYLLKIQL